MRVGGLAHPAPARSPTERRTAVPALLARITERHVVIALAVLAGVSGELLAAVSMTRIAGPAIVEAGQTAGALGFPYALRWTLFAVVSVAGWVGAVLWTSDNPGNRPLGRLLNLPAALIAGVFVGLDHAQHAPVPEPWQAVGPWQALAFIAGPLITLVSSAMLHVIAKLRDRADARTGGPRVPASSARPPRTPEQVPRPAEPEPESDTGPLPAVDTADADLGPARSTREQRIADLADAPGPVPEAALIADRYGCSTRTAFRLRADAIARREAAS